MIIRCGGNNIAATPVKWCDVTEDNDERSFLADVALDIANMWALDEGYSFKSFVPLVFEELSSETVRVQLVKDMKLISSGSGKGIGKGAWASGYYEAIEHAVIAGVINNEELSNDHEISKLPPNPEIEKVYYGYTYAMTANQGRPQQIVRLSRVTNSYELNHEDQITYPAILVDPYLRLEPEMGELLALAPYTSTTGIASGNSVRDALLHAVHEVVERDADSYFLVELAKGNTPFKFLDLPEDSDLNKLFLKLTSEIGRKGWLILLESVAGYVVCAYAESLNKTSETEIGYGCSFDINIATRRAIMELQQIRASVQLGETWTDEGAVDIKNLRSFPKMREISERRFDLDSYSCEHVSICKYQGKNLNVIEQLRTAGYPIFGRVIWQYDTGLGSIVVVQAIIPGLEVIDNLVFNRPILPLGRMRSAENIRFLSTTK